MPASIRREVQARPRAALISRRAWGFRSAVPLAALALTVVAAAGIVRAEPSPPSKEAIGELAQSRAARNQDVPPSASGGPSSLPPLSFAAPISTRTMLSRLEQPWVQLVDVRTPEEFSGRDIRALRGGHIPGAINIPLQDGLQSGASTAIQASPERRLAELDVRKETIVYGRDAQQASQAAERLRELGFRDLRVYVDAWHVWGNTLELPVAGERFADVAALRLQLDALQQRVAQLARQVAAASEPLPASARARMEPLAPSSGATWEQHVSSRQASESQRTVISR